MVGALPEPVEPTIFERSQRKTKSGLVSEDELKLLELLTPT